MVEKYIFGSLKSISLILAFFTFTLSMLPCDDEVLVSSVGDTTAQHHEEHGHGHQHGSDHCSPFCVCAVTNVAQIEFDFTDIFTETVFETPRFFYLAPFSTVYPTTVFQPPKA